MYPFKRPDEDPTALTFSACIGCLCIIAVAIMSGLCIGVCLWFAWGVTKYSQT